MFTENVTNDAFDNTMGKFFACFPSNFIGFYKPNYFPLEIVTYFAIEFKKFNISYLNIIVYRLL